MRIEENRFSRQCNEAIDVIKQVCDERSRSSQCIQLAAELALTEKRTDVGCRRGVGCEQQSNPSASRKKIPAEPQIGFVNGLAVYGPNMGTLLEIEVTAIPRVTRKGAFTITGVVDEEELGGGHEH